MGIKILNLEINGESLLLLIKVDIIIILLESRIF